MSAASKEELDQPRRARYVYVVSAAVQPHANHGPVQVQAAFPRDHVLTPLEALDAAMAGTWGLQDLTWLDVEILDLEVLATREGS